MNATKKATNTTPPRGTLPIMTMLAAMSRRVDSKLLALKALYAAEAMKNARRANMVESSGRYTYWNIHRKEERASKGFPIFHQE